MLRGSHGSVPNSRTVLARELQAHLLNLGALALEMHQRGDLDRDPPDEARGQAAETERELDEETP
jgi:hypothetical protein